MNKIRIRLSLVALVTILPIGVALASPALPSPTPAPPAVSSDDSAMHVTTLKDHGTAEADRRLALLQTVETRLTDSTQMADADKSVLTKRIDAQVTLLGALKNKLANESDLTATRNDIQSIIDEYQVFGLLVAQISLVTSADRMTEAQTQLQTVVTKLQKRTNALKKAGKDTTGLQKTLDKARASVNSAEPLYNKLTAQIVAFKVTNYVADHNTLSGYLDNIATARDDFRIDRSCIDDALAAIDKLK
jgi:hypothetical protein